MISRSLSSKLLKPALSSASSLYSHSAPWITNAMTTPEFQPSRTGTLLHGSTQFCTDSSSKLFHVKSKYFQSSHSKNHGSHLKKLKILDARFVISSSAHNVAFRSPSSSVGNIRFFSTNEQPENPNQIPNSEEILFLAEDKRKVLGRVRKHMNKLSNAMTALGVVQLGTWIHLISSPIIEIWLQCLLAFAIPICAARAFRSLSKKNQGDVIAGGTIAIILAILIAAIGHIVLGFQVANIILELEYLLLTVSVAPVTTLLGSLLLVSYPSKSTEGASKLQEETWRLQQAKRLDRFFVRSRRGVYFILCGHLIIWSIAALLTFEDV